MLRGIFSPRKDRPGPEASAGGLTVIGVRHHSPACARRVEEIVGMLKPAYVLIEGPSDFNAFIGDLKLAHDLPVAIFSFYSSAERSYASYSPFCSYSPEWRALQSAWEVGAEPLFCDLPAWHPGFGARANRYADAHSQRAERAAERLGRAMGEDGGDALWDALAEQATPQQIGERLERYFDLLRPDGADDPAEAARERFMAGYAAWALREARGRPVVLVCGGWHARAIERYATEATGDRPQLEQLVEGERTGSYVAPYDYQRLDRFTGYASGMPSPAYYEHVAEYGLAKAADWAVNEISSRLRKMGQVVSTADRIAWQTHAEGLALTRGHAGILRSDLLDSALATLIKDGLEAPAAWTGSGAVTSDTHPVVVAVLRAISGDRRGKLAAGTRQPPLVPDVEERLRGLDLEPRFTPRELELDWNLAEDRAKAQTLHALALIKWPCATHVSGPAMADTIAPRERFRLQSHRDAQGVLIEASRWGGTLPMAAAALLADKATQANGNLGRIATCVSEALFAGLLGLDAELVRQLKEGIAASHDIGEIGAAGLSIVELYRFGEIFGVEAHKGLGKIAAMIFERVLWLIEGIESEEDGLRSINAVLACREMIRDCPDLAIDRGAMLAALGRCANGSVAPAALSGSALGCLIACGDVEAAAAKQRLRLFGRAEVLGDFLSGLFALAREQVTTQDDAAAGLTGLVASWGDDEFLLALPAMRQAFSWFPPRERERLAYSILRAAGYSVGQAEVEALAWMRQRVNIVEQASAIALEAKVAKRLAEAGLE